LSLNAQTMLNVQRTRHSHEQEEVQLPRIVLLTYLAAGWTAPVLYFLLESYKAAAFSTSAFIVSAVAICGVCAAHSWCRIILGIVWLATSLLGVIYVLHILPAIPTHSATLVPPGFAKFWLGLTNLGSFVAAMIVLIHPKMRKAARQGFKLW
jgi:hypothetical protein